MSPIFSLRVSFQIGRVVFGEMAQNLVIPSSVIK